MKKNDKHINNVPKSKIISEWNYPILFIICVLPFVTKFITYSNKLSSYSWYSQISDTYDFFVYYKSRCIVLVGLLITILIILRVLLNGIKIKQIKACAPIMFYSGFVILSSIFSVESYFSTIGMVDQFENVFVLLSYVLIIFYAYIISNEECGRSIVKYFSISLFFMFIISGLEMIRKGLVENEFLKKIVMSQEDYLKYGSYLEKNNTTNAISLTFNNPNNASVYIAMAITFITVMCIYFIDDMKNKKTKIAVILLCTLNILLYIMLIKTNSRTGLFSLIPVGTLLVYIIRKKLRSSFKVIRFRIILILLVFITLFMSVDWINNFFLTDKIIRTFHTFRYTETESGIESIITSKSNVEINYMGKSMLFYINDEDKLLCKYDGLEFKQNTIFPEISEIKFKRNNNFNNVGFTINIDEKDWNFVKLEEEYYYVNDYGKRENLGIVETFGLTKYEKIASGRGYIWSRTIPLLRDTFFIGTGPDTFPLVFPQNDRVGKYKNCKEIYTVIEKPHNGYLQSAIQTGILSLLCLVLFYIKYFIDSWKLYRNISIFNFKEAFGVACFLVTTCYSLCIIFVDSSVHITPIVCVFCGLGMGINRQQKSSS